MRAALFLILLLEIASYFAIAAIRLRQQQQQQLQQQQQQQHQQQQQQQQQQQHQSAREGNSSYRILFIGGSHVFFASASPTGFISVIRKTLSQLDESFHTEIDVFGGNNYLMDDIHRDLPNYLDQWQSSVPPFEPMLLETPTTRTSTDANPPSTTIAIVMLGYDDVVRDASRHVQGKYRDIRNSLSHILASLVDANVSHIAVCTSLLYGEKVDYSNPFDEELEELSGILKVTARLFQVDVIDIRMDILKATEKLNVENLSGSILTYDGEHLNEHGNNVVAISLLKYLGLELHQHDIRMPSPPKKNRRYHNRYHGDVLLEESSHSGHQYVDEMDWKFDEL